MDYESLGLKLIPDFITLEEEQEILNCLDKNIKIKKTKSRNSIKRYGSNAPYKSNIVSKEIPDFLNKYCDRLYNDGYVSVKPDSVSINEYLTGQEITYHIDSKESGSVISVLSLLSPATMLFKNKHKTFNVEVLPRMLSQMSGEIRNLWQHAISPVKDTRYSIVFRCSPQAEKHENNS